MKSITNILRRSNLTPFERVRTLVHSDLHKEKTGKDALSESDIHSLTKGWRGTNSEINEYNKYIKIVQLEDSMKMDAQMFLYRSELSILRNQRVLDGFIHRSRLLNNIDEASLIQDISDEESINFIIKNTYLEYDKVLHIFTFNNLTREIKNDLTLLDKEVDTSSEYLEDQVFLYEIFNGKKKINEDDKNLIIDRIYSRMYFEGIKTIKKNPTEKDGFLLHTCFAELPTKELFVKIIKDAHLTYEDEESNILSSVEEYAKGKNMSMEKLIKDKLAVWLDDGLFTKEYSPLYLSNRFDTWNGDTKNNHKKLFRTWHKELQESRKYLQKLLDDRKLEKEIIERDFLGVIRKTEIISGLSLHTCSEKISFVEEYKKQIEIVIPVSKMFLFIRKNAEPVKNRSTLCAFKDLSEKTSSVFDIDMTGIYSRFIKHYEEELRLLNASLSRLPDIIMERLYKEDSFKYILGINDECFNFDASTENDADDIINKYKEKFDELKI